MRTFHLCIIFLPPSARMTRPERFTPLRIPAYNRHAASSVAGSKVTDNHSIPVLPNRILSSGFFPCPVHGEPGQGSAGRQTSVVAGKLFFATVPRVFPPRFQFFSRYRLLLLAPFLRRRGSFVSQPAAMRSWMARLTVASDRPVSRETVGMDGKQVPSLLLRSRR